jgi:hypothetical protein
MGKLTDLLKAKKPTEKIEESSIAPVEVQVANAVVSQPMSQPSENNDGQNDLIFDLTEEEIQKVRESVVEIDKTDKNRRQIIIGMFGGIKNPKTGKRFVIPGVDFSTEDYVYEYAKHMRILVNKPEDFKKIMNWE